MKLIEKLIPGNLYICSKNQGFYDYDGKIMSAVSYPNYLLKANTPFLVLKTPELRLKNVNLESGWMTKIISGRRIGFLFAYDESTEDFCVWKL